MNVSKLLIEAYRLGVFESCWKRLTEDGSYFSNCPRDEHGHCKSSGKDEGPHSRPEGPAHPQAPGGSGNKPAGWSRTRPPTPKITVRAQRRINRMRRRLTKDQHGDQQVAQVHQIANEKTTKDLRKKVQDNRDAAAQYLNYAVQANQQGNSTLETQLTNLVESSKDNARKFEQLVAKRVTAAMRPKTPATIKVSSRITDPKLRKDCEGAAAILSSVVGRKAIRKFTIKAKIDPSLKRPHYDPDTGTIHLPKDYQTSDILHEVGHLIESRNPKIKQMNQDFLALRCGKEKYRNMKPFQHPQEWGRRDEFEKTFPGRPDLAYYVGKHYPDGTTEVLTMGLQALIDSPETLAGNDPEFFKYLAGVLSGRHL